MPQCFSIAETSRKSAPFRGGDLRGTLRPSPRDYRAAFASSGLRYPLDRPPSLRSGYHPSAGSVGLTQLIRSEDPVGAGWDLWPGGACEHRQVQASDLIRPAYRFGACLSAPLAGSPLRAVTRVLCVRSTAPTSPSPGPTWGCQASEHCPRGSAPWITPQHARVGAPGCYRVQRGEPAGTSDLILARWVGVCDPPPLWSQPPKGRGVVSRRSQKSSG